MPYQLCESVSFCWADRRAVFLDARRDRYFRLATPAEAIFRSLWEAGGQAVPDVEQLLRQGLVEATDDVVRPFRPARARPPTMSLVDCDPGAEALRPLTLAEVSWRLARARVKLKRSALATTLSRLRDAKTRKTTTAGMSRTSVADLARRFNAARRRAPFPPSCLPDALALLDFLARHEVFPDLVFGVRLDPFRAHCWVQAEETVLNDALDPAIAHTPILVV
jgi:hypothetical protein